MKKLLLIGLLLFSANVQAKEFCYSLVGLMPQVYSLWVYPIISPGEVAIELAKTMNLDNQPERRQLLIETVIGSHIWYQSGRDLASYQEVIIAVCRKM